MNIDKIAMCCISMDSSKQALQNNKKLFSNFDFFFFRFLDGCNVYVVLEQVVFELLYFVCDAVNVVL